MLIKQKIKLLLSKFIFSLRIFYFSIFKIKVISLIKFNFLISLIIFLKKYPLSNNLSIFSLLI